MLTRPKLNLPPPESVAAEGVRDMQLAVRCDLDPTGWSRSLLSSHQDQEELDDIQIVGPLFENWVAQLEQHRLTSDWPITSVVLGTLVALGFNAAWNARSSRPLMANALLLALLGGGLAGGAELLYRHGCGSLPLVPDEMPQAPLEEALSLLQNAEDKISRLRGIRASWQRRAVKHNARLQLARSASPAISQVLLSTARLGSLLK
jgi:hypothetical protein